MGLGGAVVAAIDSGIVGTGDCESAETFGWGGTEGRERLDFEEGMIRLRVRTGPSFESRGEYRVGWLKRSHRSHCCAKTAPTGDKYFSDKVSLY